MLSKHSVLSILMNYLDFFRHHVKCVFLISIGQQLIRASLEAQMGKNLPAMQDNWVQSLDREDPLEKGMATHSNILAWTILWTEEPSRLQSVRSQSQTQLRD